MKTLDIGQIKVNRGEKLKTSLGSIRTPSGNLFGLPCIAAHGSKEGPLLVVSGATHGNEIVGTGATIRAMQMIEPKKLRGSVIAIPVVNAAAFDQGVYATPQDGRNMASRIYWHPNAEGTMTARLGALLAPLYQMASVYIDLHGNREPSAPMSMMFLKSARDRMVRDMTIEVANAFGVTSVDMSDPVAHPDRVGPADQYAVPAAMENGVPALMVELLSSNTVLDADRGSKGVLNVMRHLGMIDGAIEAQDPLPLPGRYRYWGSLGAQAAGILWPRVRPGVLVAKGTVVAEISNVFGDVLETVTSPANGFLWSFNGGHYGASTHALPEGSDIGYFAERIE